MRVRTKNTISCKVLRKSTFVALALFASRAMSSDDLLFDNQQFLLDPSARVFNEQPVSVDTVQANENDKSEAQLELANVVLQEKLNLNKSALPLLSEQPLPGEITQNKGNAEQSNVVKTVGLKAGDAALILPGEYFSSGYAETEVAQFVLTGRGAWEGIRIDDLDLAIAEDGSRYLPLIRLLERFEVRILAQTDRLVIQTDWGSEVNLDLNSGAMELNGSRQKIEFITGISDITGAREVYIPAAVAAEIFDISLAWDESNYAYNAASDHSFAIWEKQYERFRGLSATTVAPIGMPEVHGAASPDKPLVGFVKTRANYSSRYTDLSGTALNASFSESIWGHFGGGRYRLNFDQSSLAYQQHSGFTKPDRDYSIPSRFDWTRTYDNHELSLGDAGFSLNDLAFPFINLTGVRASGTFALGGQDSEKSQSFGNFRNFVKTKSYTGTAEEGSVVELVINNRIVETIIVREDPALPAGYGTYEFADVSIPSGSLVDIKIEIKEPNGTEITLDKSTIRGDSLLPEGQLVYIGGMGTDRNRLEWGADGIMAGGRVLYGLNSRVTLGATLAHQTGIHARNQFESSVRTYADQSSHIGTEVSWLAFSNLMLSADLAQSFGSSELQKDMSFDGMGARVRGNWYPFQGLDFSAQYFRYDNGFFNGVSAELQDREGYSVRGTWRNNAWFNLDGTVGEISDNLERENETTNTLGFQNLTLTTKTIPYSAFYLSANRFTPNENDEVTQLTVGANFDFPSFYLAVRKQGAQSGRLGYGHSQLFNGVTVDGNLDLASTESMQVSLAKVFAGEHRLTFDWTENGDYSRRVSVDHDWRGMLFEDLGWMPLGLQDKFIGLSTEVGHDSWVDSYYIRNRLNFSLNNNRGNRISLTSEYDQNRGFGIFIDVSMESLFANSGSGYKVSRATSYLNPEYGGVKGRVYLDQNGNAQYDPGEPGVPDIGVLSEGSHGGMMTNEQGLFSVSKQLNQDELRLFLNEETIPAHYKPTHGLQTAFLERGAYTEVNFGVAPLVSVAGKLQGQRQENLSGYEPIVGARVYLTDQSGKTVGESVTGNDGSFYLDSIPGRYSLQVDPKTIDKKLLLLDRSRELVISGTEEFQELEVQPLLAKIISDRELERIRRGDYNVGEFDLDIPLIKESINFDAALGTENFEQLLFDSIGFDL